MVRHWIKDLRVAGFMVLILALVAPVALAQDTETPATVDDILAQLEQIRDQLRDNPDAAPLKEQLQTLHEQLKEDRFNADLIAQAAILREQIRELQDPALVVQTAALREQLHTLIEENGGPAFGHGPRFVDEDGDGVNDGFQHGMAMRGMHGMRGEGLARLNEIFVDIDGDGVIDQVQVDTDGDGVGDETLQEHLQARWEALDTDGDGVPDVGPPAGDGEGKGGPRSFRGHHGRGGR